MHALARRMQCGCADRRAANGEDVADIVQLGILRLLELRVAFLPGERPRCFSLRLRMM